MHKVLGVIVCPVQDAKARIGLKVLQKINSFRLILVYSNYFLNLDGKINIASGSLASYLNVGAVRLRHTPTLQCWNFRTI